MSWLSSLLRLLRGERGSIRGCGSAGRCSSNSEQAHIAWGAQCHVGGLACAYAMGASAYAAIWTEKQVFLAGKVSAHPSHLRFMMNGAGKMTAGGNVWSYGIQLSWMQLLRV